MGINEELFGQTDRTNIKLFTLSNDHGLQVEVMSYGATLTAVRFPDSKGSSDNLTLYLETWDDYLAGHPFFGSTVGRFANRIADAKFELDGKTYFLVANNGTNHLHGGSKGFDKKAWKAAPEYGTDRVSVVFSCTSPDTEANYPGNLSAEAIYTVTNDNELIIDYRARTDAPTHVNLTNHAYWNLAGATSGDVLDHELMINADRFLPIDNRSIPLGSPAPVKGSPMDFTTPKPIGAEIVHVEGGYDHCYVLNKEPGGGRFSLAARVVEPKSGRVMEVFTTQPGVQFYTANGLNGTHKADGHAYEKHDGFCLETQHYPDSPNRPEYPSTLLKPGEVYREVTVFRFSHVGDEPKEKMPEFKELPPPKKPAKPKSEDKPKEPPEAEAEPAQPEPSTPAQAQPGATAPSSPEPAPPATPQPAAPSEEKQEKSPASSATDDAIPRLPGLP